MRRSEIRSAMALWRSSGSYSGHDGWQGVGSLSTTTASPAWASVNMAASVGKGGGNGNRDYDGEGPP